MTVQSVDSRWPALVFYDGACPLCAREVLHYRKRDRLNRLTFIDIARPEFSPDEFGLDPARVQQVMHLRTADGRLFTAVAAFRILWQALPPSLAATFALAFLRIPGMTALANLFYRAFARNRYRLTGRCTSTSCPPQ